MNSVAEITSSAVSLDITEDVFRKTKSNFSKQELHDTELVARIAGGEKRAEDEFVRLFRPQLCSLLTKLIGDPNRAEDITHDALILVLDRLRCEGIQKPNKLTSYVFSTAKFSFYGWLRKKDNQLELMDCLADVVFTEHPQESECMQVQASDTLKAQIQKLRVSRDRDILTRRYLGDQTKQEICEALTLTPEHYDRVISRARTRLKSVYLNQ